MLIPQLFHSKEAFEKELQRRGKIAGYTPLDISEFANNSMSQSDSVDDFLEHFGVRGMHWGVRRAKAPPSIDSATSSDTRTKIKDSGGTHALTNKELQAYITRANLEQQYSRIDARAPAHKQAHNFIKGLLGAARTVNEVYTLYNSPVAKEIRKAIEKR